jgi:AhpC/TSA antioxidant enzyme
MLDRADDLARLAVIDEDGRTVQLGALWADGPAVLVFLRHFGCIHCRDHAAQLDRAKLPANVALIGNGSPSFIAGLREHTGWTGAVYTDPSLAAYRAAQLERGVLRTLDPRGYGKALRAMAAGQRQGRTQGDPWQQGGVLVVGKDGRVLWQHASARAGDNAAPAQILAALR